MPVSAGGLPRVAPLPALPGGHWLRRQMADTRARRRQALLMPASAFAASRLLLLLLALIVPVGGTQASLGWFERLVKASDAGWYLKIASGGYTHAHFDALHPAQQNWAFFPLFPVVTRVLGDTLHLPLLAIGLLLGNACFLGFLIVLYRWVAEDWGRRSARAAVALAAFSPLSAYFAGFRPDAMFLFLSALCLERTVHRRLGQAAGAGALASLADPTGILLVVPFVLACVRLLAVTRHRRAGVARLCLAPLFGVGGLTMMLVSQADAGSPLAFLGVQAAWGRSFRFPFTALVTFLVHPHLVTDHGWSSPPVSLVALVVGLAAAWYLWHVRAPLELVAYVMAVVIGATASTVLMGVPRFVADTVPLYIAGGLAVRRVTLPVLVLSTAALVTYSALWLTGADWTMALR